MQPGAITFPLAAAIATALLVQQEVTALPTFPAKLPNGDKVPGIKAIGHVAVAGGGPRNQFGLDFASAGTEWTEELCYKDSDGDGQFNGAELGDPCCEFVLEKNEKVAYDTASAPGDKTLKNDPKLWADVTCTNGEDVETKMKAFLGGDAPAPASGSGGNAPVSPADGDDDDGDADKDTAKDTAKDSSADASTPETTDGASTMVASASAAAVVAIAALFA